MEDKRRDPLISDRTGSEMVGTGSEPPASPTWGLLGGSIVRVQLTWLLLIGRPADRDRICSSLLTPETVPGVRGGVVFGRRWEHSR